MKLLIVESPAKAKTINKYLGKDYKVLASVGHVRDLPSKNGSVVPENDFEMLWEVDKGSEKNIKPIVEALKSADGVILATDPDREGEAISWHVLEILKKKRLLKNKTVERVTFNEITKSAVKKAMENPRQIDDELVEAYLARRALDYLVGFTLSPVLWRKLPGSRSAGRVQSVALRLICERESEREKFTVEEYWSVDGLFKDDKHPAFGAKLVAYNGEKLEKLSIKDEKQANQITDALRQESYSLTSTEEKTTSRNPAPPFITSTLQQEAARKLYFSATRTMRTAQNLYEGVSLGGETVGLITYMRTDGVSLAGEAISQARSHIEGNYGSNYLPSSPRIYKSKAKNAQEAHEAIRPTDIARTPESMKPYLNEDQYKLYELIWKRTVACQMASAKFDQVVFDIESSNRQHQFRASGSVLKFDGFLRVYQEGQDDKTKDGEKEVRLPALVKGTSLTLEDLNSDQHFTQPPPRYSEASLVKKMEELGIGRPSTYASILQVLQAREYVKLDKRRFFPEERGRIVTTFLEIYFNKYVEYSFTAELEERLDDISSGEVKWKDVLRDFWTKFHAATESTKDLKVSDVLDKMNEELKDHLFPQTDPDKDPRQCPQCSEGQLHLKLSRFGAFIGCNAYPECKYTKQLTSTGDADAEGGDQSTLNEPRILGNDPETGLEISIRKGPYGFYIQLGEAVGKTKPKRAPLLKSMTAETATLEEAQAVLSLPRALGTHPETGQEIQAGVGRYGPYVKIGSTFKSIKTGADVLTISLDEALKIIAESGPQNKEIGIHPEDGKPVLLASGRYGPYIKHDKTNAPIPKGVEPDTITLEKAVELIAERKAKAPKKPKKKS